MQIKEEPSNQHHFFSNGDYRYPKTQADPHMYQPDEYLSRQAGAFGLFHPSRKVFGDNEDVVYGRMAENQMYERASDELAADTINMPMPAESLQTQGYMNGPSASGMPPSMDYYANYTQTPQFGVYFLTFGNPNKN